MFEQKHTVAQALRPIHLLRSQISSHETSLDRRPPRAPRFISAENISIVVTWACFGQLPFFQRSVTAIATSQRRAKIRIWNLNTYGIFNDLFQSKINVLHLSKFLRSISWEPSVMIGWASQMDARETLCCFCNPKKKERTLDFNRYKLPHRYWNSFFKNERLGILSQKMLFPPCVVVDFFFDEEERRYAITRRQRKEHKKGEKLARASQNSPYSNPLCPFFPSSFHSFICHAGGEIQKRSICISKTERKQTMKKRAPTLPPTIIDRGLSMIAMRVTFSRACARARKKKVILYALSLIHIWRCRRM